MDTMEEHLQELRRRKKLPYNTTDLDPETVFERHVFHRDFLAHYLRWTHILKEAKVGDTVVDFGCGSGNLLEVLYRNKFKCKRYVGLDIRKQTIEQAKKKFEKVEWAEFYAVDLIKDDYPYHNLFKADKVCSFEVIEHVGQQNVYTFLEHFRACGHKDATYYLSTPNYDEQVGAAGNHTYDSGDGRGVAVQEFKHEDLEFFLIDSGFEIVRKFGTFASQRDYKPLLSEWQQHMFTALSAYYDSNLIANIMAPMFPEQSRNTLWVLKQAS